MSHHTIVETSLVRVVLIANDRGLSRLVMSSKRGDALHAWVQREFPEVAHEPDLLPGLQQQLRDYFEGKPVRFRVKTDLSEMTPFRRKALEACAAIPHGKTATYGELAERIGSPRAARAIGGAMSSNPLPIVIPCHRVVGCNGHMGGFSAEQGVPLKRQLLDLEQRAACVV